MIELISDIAFAIGGVLAVFSGVGLLRLKSTLARFHAAGKASPVALVFICFGAALRMDALQGGLIAVIAVSLLLTFPVAVHLLFRSVGRLESPSKQ